MQLIWLEFEPSIWSYHAVALRTAAMCSKINKLHYITIHSDHCMHAISVSIFHSMRARKEIFYALHTLRSAFRWGGQNYIKKFIDRNSDFALCSHCGGAMWPISSIDVIWMSRRVHYTNWTSMLHFFPLQRCICMNQPFRMEYFTIATSGGRERNVTYREMDRTNLPFRSATKELLWDGKIMSNWMNFLLLERKVH